jgi:hypothetical protein
LTLDVDVVLNTIVTRANDLIGADGCTIFECDEITEQFHLRATRNVEPGLVELARGTPLRKGDQGILGQVPDITAGSYSSPISDALIQAGVSRGRRRAAHLRRSPIRRSHNEPQDAG